MTTAPTPAPAVGVPRQREAEVPGGPPDLRTAAALTHGERSRLGDVLAQQAAQLLVPLGRLAQGEPLDAEALRGALVACRRSAAAARALGLRVVSVQLHALDDQLTAEAPHHADPLLATRLAAHLRALSGADGAAPGSTAAPARAR